METIELKSELHRLIDELDNRNLLDNCYEEIKNTVAVSKNKIWDTLTEEQKQEVLLAAKECEDESNLVDHETVMNKYRKWLK